MKWYANRPAEWDGFKCITGGLWSIGMLTAAWVSGHWWLLALVPIIWWQVWTWGADRRPRQ